MSLTTAQKKELSKRCHVAGYSAARTAALLNISDALIAEYWTEWTLAKIRSLDEMDDYPRFVADKGSPLTEHGAGAVGTAFAPRTYRWFENEDIIKEIQIDLTGLDSSGTANDVIGLDSSGDPAYLGQQNVEEDGIIYKVEMTCLEVPTAGDADVLLVQGSAGDEEFDDTVANTATICDGTGDWALGETIQNLAPAITDDYYFYLVQGSTDDNTYTAGQFLIRMFGHPALNA